MKPEIKEMKPLEPLGKTLNAYCDGHSLDADMNKEQLLELTKGISSPYYDIVKNLAQTLILGDPNKKKRCLIWTGASDSGKSTIANYVS